MIPAIHPTTAGLGRWIAAQPALLAPLRAVAALGLPDCWIGAGFLRNPVWDALSGLPIGYNPPGDIDVVWFDPDADLATDAAAEARLHAALPGLPWSVHNQARMAARNGDTPYAGTLDAIAHWPETATAIAARWTPAGLELAAPWGLADLFARILRPTPAFATGKSPIFAARAAAKGWTRRWPGVVLDPIPPSPHSLPRDWTPPRASPTISRTDRSAR